MARFPKLAQFFYDKRPNNTSNDALFEYCVKFIASKNIDTSAHTHQQWANILFSYESSSVQRSCLMTKVHNTFGLYFTGKGFRYDFNINLIVQNYPQWFMGHQTAVIQSLSPTTQMLLNVNNAINQEITQSVSPKNRESYRILDWTEHPYNNKYIYTAQLEIRDGSDPHFREGLQIHINNGSRSYIGEVIEYDYVEGILYLTSSNRIYQNLGRMFINVDNSFILEGLKKRIITYSQTGIAQELPVYKFIDKTTDKLRFIKHDSIPDSISAELDKAQNQAFQAALNHDITFIWGPPGTGKSFTLAAIVRGLYQIENERTIVCCVSNVAVDQLANKVVDCIEREHLSIQSGNFYRAGHTTDERIINTDFLFPDDDTTRDCRHQIEYLKLKVKDFTLKNEKLYADRIIELKAEIKDLRVQLKERTDYLVQRSRVVFSTISNFILSDRINQSNFDNLIVDEASMLALPSLLALGGKIKKRIILVGDFQQLSPIALVPNSLLTQNVFKRCGIDIEHTNHPALHLLLNQRRSHAEIVKLINQTFYQNKLVATVHQSNEITNSAPFAGKTIAKVTIKNGVVRFTKGGTRQNPISANRVLALLDELKDNVSFNVSIGVITPYKGQANLLRAFMKEKRNYPASYSSQIKIGTVHTFQGSECDIIIFDIVDCCQTTDGKKASVGRIYSGTEGEQLLNVAVSRARHKLIVVGDIDWFINYAPGNSVSNNTLRIFRNI